MTNEQKIATLKEQDYGAIDFSLHLIEGVIAQVNCAYNYMNGDFETLYNLDDVDVIKYGNNYFPIAKANMHHFAQCATCGEWLCLEEDTYIEDNNGNYYHDNYRCTDNEVFWCEYHEQYERYIDTDCRTVNTRYGEQTWCESACYDHAFWSEYSEEYWSNSDYYARRVYNSNRNYQVWTDNEADDNACWCDRCENYFESDWYDYDAECCIECAGGDAVNGACINTYHTSKNSNSLDFFGTSHFTKWAGFGGELEIDTTYDNARENQQKLLNALKEEFGDRITFERDGSLDNGFEIITAPHTKEEMDTVDWAKLMQLCKDYGYRSHDTSTCGLHFHVSGNMFGATREKMFDTIAKVIAFYERYFDDFVKLSRRGGASRWASNYGLTYNGNMNDYKQRCRAIVDRMDYNDRYYAINLTNTCREDGTKVFRTVEFRINRGTLNYNTFRASYNLIYNLIKNAKKISWDDPNFFDPKKWLKGCEANTYAYINKRNAFEGVFYMPQTQANTEYTQEIVQA
jgi:hypothetical protein